ncbi:DoxX family membrane protein [Aureivirga sp. CE67]|uniref:DoxX family membrane protein n=1 Tax=Aureivirga sp. CE67 TaxID=1788983 RepID=UPI0018C8F19D|nr:DoxX family membrane protein [Aureivirga sp. CE67]
MKASDFLRIILGFNFLFHLISRLFSGIPDFAQWMSLKFEETFIPASFTTPFAFILPFIEGIIGLLLILNLFTKTAVYAGFIVLLILISGTSLLADWNLVAFQMLYVLIFYFVLKDIEKKEKLST